MKKYLDKLKKKLYFNKNLFVFLFVLVMVGLFAGALFSVILSDSDKRMVSDYLNNFLLNLSIDKINFNISFFNTLIFTLGFALLIWVFGISIIGVLLVLPFLFLKSFVLGFSVGSILLNFKIKGIILSLIYIVPHHVINLLIYILICAYSIMISYRMVTCMCKKKNFDFKLFMSKYSFILIFSLIILFITSLYESFVLPYVLKFVFNIIK
ncbi:MAG: stage II sporulation protein M [Bacilli bacterium]|nr:stage II sporulation protein M [Bacilli bacterium]